MKSADIFNSIFKKGSVTYYYSSIFFPASIRNSVFILYAYVRLADNLVDSLPPDTQGYNHFVSLTDRAFSGIPTGDIVIDNFYHLCLTNSIPYSWVKSFLDSMARDLTQKSYQTYPQLEDYVYGSADVIGLMMAKIMKLPQSSYPYAQALGKAMQLINFIRDINEDISLGRIYIPLEDLRRFGLTPENFTSSQYRSQFINLVNFQINRIRLIFDQAQKGFVYIPHEFLIPVKTATDMYLWTCRKILLQPSLIFRTKLRPSPSFVILTYLKNKFFS